MVKITLKEILASGKEAAKEMQKSSKIEKEIKSTAKQAKELLAQSKKLEKDLESEDD